MKRDEITLWQNWFDHRKVESMHELLEFYKEWLLKLVRHFYAKYYIGSCELGDFHHWGTIGLIESIQRYRLVEGAKFETFAYHRVKGEILNQLNRSSEGLAQYRARKSQIIRERFESNTEFDEQESSFDKLFPPQLE